jgi:hypothetical protein
MATSLDARLDAIQRRNLVIDGEGLVALSQTGGVNRGRYREADHQFSVALNDQKRKLGKAVARAIEIAKLERKALAGLLGYADDSCLYRWINGVDSPPMHRLLAIPAFAAGFLIAVAEVYEHERIQGEYAVRVRFPA